MKRLIALNRFFYPDHSATGQILTDLKLKDIGCGKSRTALVSLTRSSSTHHLGTFSAQSLGLAIAEPASDL